MRVDAPGLMAWRAAAQGLNGPRFAGPVETAAWMVAVQAQDARGGRWSLGLRTAGVEDEQVLQALRTRRIVRTWLMRGTLHYAAAPDVGWLLALLAPGIIRAAARRYRELGLDEPVFARSRRLLEAALGREGPLTRSELRARFEYAGLPAKGQQLPYLLQRAALEGVICVDEGAPNNPVYALLEVDELLPHLPDRTAALARLAQRYATSRGPVKVVDFAWWAGLGMQEARRAMELAGLKPVQLGDVVLWASGEPPASFPAAAALLAPFDEYLLSYKERAPALAPAYVKRVNAGGGMFKPTVMLNGEIAGLWRAKEGRDGAQVIIESFRSFTRAEEEQVEEAAAAWGRFGNRPLRLVQFADR